MPNIIITRRVDDFHAALEGNPAVWARSEISADDAVDNLVRSHPMHLGISIEWDTEDARTLRFLKDNPHTP